MPYYMVRLWLEAPLATPMISGTLFGHLCWAYRWRHGSGAFQDWLRGLEPEPLLVSDAMPRGYLPKPLVRVLPRDPHPEEGVQLKTFKKQSWISRDQFLQIRDHLNEDALFAALKADEASRAQERGRKRSEDVAPGELLSVRSPHNTIDRRTGRTPEQGGLYFADEDWPSLAAQEREVYVYSNMERHSLAELFELTGKFGYGRDASTGRGRFSVCGVEEAPEGLFEGGGNRRMSLSHGSLTPNMDDPRYRLHAHYGKVGGLFAVSARPFKQPVTLLRPGATFQPLDAGPYGELLRGVYSENHDVVFSAWHLTVPYTEVN